MKTELKTKKENIILPIILIIILGFIVYSNSLAAKFIWDDESLVVTNLYIRNWSNISKAFTESIAAGAGLKEHFYRPIQVISYMADYSLWKLNVKGYHFTNILLHVMAALSVFWLVSVLFKDKIISLFTALLFVAHPIHTEAVTYISGRADSIALPFMLICFVFYIKQLYSSNIIMYLLMTFCYILALLSRENSLILPLLLLLYNYIFAKKIKIKEFYSILSIAILYILARITLLESFLYKPKYDIPFMQRLPGFFAAIANYIKLLFLPFDLHMEYGLKLFKPNSPEVILGFLILFVLLTYGFIKKESNRLISFSILWFFTALLPVSNIYPINAYMAEHWLYVPSIGFFLILAKWFSSMYKTKKLKVFSIVCISILSVFYSAITLKQNSYWGKPIILYKRILNYTPNSPRVHSNLGNAYSDVGRNEEAIASYKKAIELDPTHLDAYYNLGLTYKDAGKKEEAINLFKKVIEINPKHVEAYNNLGNLYGELGRRQEAIDCFKKAIEIKVDYAEAYSNLAITYYYDNQYQLAIEYCNKAKELGFVNPTLLEALKPYREK